MFISILDHHWYLMNIYYLCGIWCWDLRTRKWIKLQVPPSSREDRQKVTLMNKDKYSIDLCSTCHRNVEEGAVEFTWIWASHVAQFSSVQFSCSVVSNSLWPHGLQRARLPCPSATPGAYSNSSPSRQWCHPSISSSVIPFSSMCIHTFTYIELKSIQQAFN